MELLKPLNDSDAFFELGNDTLIIGNGMHAGHHSIIELIKLGCEIDRLMNRYSDKCFPTASVGKDLSQKILTILIILVSLVILVFLVLVSLFHLSHMCRQQSMRLLVRLNECI